MALPSVHLTSITQKSKRPSEYRAENDHVRVINAKSWHLGQESYRRHEGRLPRLCLAFRAS